MSGTIQNTLLAFVALAAVALLVQTIGVLVLLLIFRKAAKNLRQEFQQYRAALLPAIDKTREIVESISPNVEKAAQELAIVASRLRQQTAQFQAAADDIIGRTQSQVGRADRMLTSVFDRVERASVFVSGALSGPVRQVSGLIASAKAVVETLRDPEPHGVRAPRHAEGEPLSSRRSTGTTTPIR